MQYIMVEDDGYFQYFSSLEEMYQAIEYGDEVVYALDEKGRAYDVLQDTDMSLRLVPRPDSLGSGHLARLWIKYVERWPCSAPFRRKTSTGESLVKDIFQVLSLMDGRLGPTDWRVNTASECRTVDDFSGVTRFCGRLNPEELQSTIVADPYGRRYRPIDSAKRIRRGRACILFEEL